VRLDDAAPKAVVTASCGVEAARVVEYAPILAKALDLSKSPVKPVVVCKHREPTAVRPDLPARESVAAALRAHAPLDWDAEVAAAKPLARPTIIKSTDPLYALYTSGTTGTPKGIVRDAGGYATMLGVTYKHFMSAKLGDTCFTASDIGWCVRASRALPRRAPD